MRFHSLLVSAIMLMPFSMVADDLLKAIPFEQVTLEDNFWRPRLIIQKETLVPFALDKVRPAIFMGGAQPRTLQHGAHV